MSAPKPAVPNPKRHYLKARRVERGWTQPQLAEMLDLTNGAVSHHEQGLRVPSPEVAYRLDRALAAGAENRGPGCDQGELVYCPAFVDGEGEATLFVDAGGRPAYVSYRFREFCEALTDALRLSGVGGLTTVPVWTTALVLKQGVAIDLELHELEATERPSADEARRVSVRVMDFIGGVLELEAGRKEDRR